jgi:type I restriction enzyme S subunit
MNHKPKLGTPTSLGAPTSSSAGMKNAGADASAPRDAKPALVPKLRFPEFREAPEWEEKRLGNEGEFLSSLTGKAGEDFDAGGARFVTYMNVFSNTFVDPKALRFVDVKQGENQNAVVRGDVFFTISSETPEEVGMSSVLLEELENCYLNSFCALFRFSESKRPNPVFTGYLLRQPLVRAYFTRKAQGSTRFNLSKDAFRSLPLCVPSPAEQQKIAECLSSVDELIGAESRKLAALKTHKKGLMQELFPRDGETQPRLRFPGFQNNGEWEEEELSKCLKKVIDYRGKAPPKSESGVPLITAKNVRFGWLDMANDEYIEEEKYDEWMSRGIPQAGDILFTTEAPLGNVALFPREGKFALGQRLLTLRAKADRCVPSFLFHSLLGPTMQGKIDFHGTGSTAKGIKSKVFVKLSFCHPGVQEQQRIAGCLSSLDELIAAQTQKLETLKTHKKGLMQQLFPSPEEEHP